MSFRFHLVSLIGMFLALGIGIAVGASVVDRATVTTLERQVDAVGRRADETNARNDRLQADNDRWEEFGAQASQELVQGELGDEGAPVPVLAVAVAGTQRDAVARLRDAVLRADGRWDGTVWLTTDWRLDQEEGPKRLRDLLALDVDAVAPDAVRRAAVARLARSLGGHELATVLPTLRGTPFAEYDEGGDTTPPLEQLPVPGTRVVVLSSDTAEVPNEDLALPLVRQLAAARVPVLVAQPTIPDPGRKAFVPAVRGDEVGSRVATVDSLRDARGLTAAVMVLDRLGTGLTGHFGIGPDADDIVPEPAS